MLMAFDTFLTKIIGRLPRNLHPFFDTLGYMTMPIVWFAVIAIIALTNTLTDELDSTVFLVLLGIPIATVLKLFIRRKRPQTIYAEAMKVKSYSFPSSHAYTAALAGGYIASLLLSDGNNALGVVIVALILIIGVSRVHIGAHYPSDVIAGWVLGVIALSILI